MHPGSPVGLVTVVVGGVVLVLIGAFVTLLFSPQAAFCLGPAMAVVVVLALFLMWMVSWRPDPGGVDLDGRTVRVREHDLVFELDLDALVIEVDPEKGRLALSDGGEVFSVFPGDDLPWLSKALLDARQRWEAERGGPISEPERRALEGLRTERETR